jgi:hypothetical protein
MTGDDVAKVKGVNLEGLATPPAKGPQNLKCGRCGVNAWKLRVEKGKIAWMQCLNCKQEKVVNGDIATEER